MYENFDEQKECRIKGLSVCSFSRKNTDASFFFRQVIAAHWLYLEKL